MDKKLISRIRPYLLPAGMAYLSAFVLGLLLVFAGSFPNPEKLQPIPLLENAGFQVMCFMLLPVFYWIYSRFFGKRRPFRVGTLALAAFLSFFFLVGFCQDVSKSESFFVPFFGMPGAVLQYGTAVFFFYVAIVLCDEKIEELSGQTGRLGKERSRKSLFFSGVLFLLVPK